MADDIRPTDDDWMSLAEFANLIGKSIGTIYNERYRGGDLPDWYNFGKKVRLRRSHVDEWIERQRQTSPAAQLAATAE